MKLINVLLFNICFFSAFISSAEPIRVMDDAGLLVELSQPARRVISLSPHITELLYSVGAGETILAAVDFSNYPEQAKNLPRIGSGYQLDVEAIINLQPDLIVGWQSGNNQAQLQQLKNLGFNLYLSEPKSLIDIAENLIDLGMLLGNRELAKKQSNKFKSELESLKLRYKDSEKVRVFYQVWQSPLFTINKQHIISSIIEMCGGDNIFKDLSILSPQVDIESVIERNPDVIVAGIGDSRDDWLSSWSTWKSINAVKNSQLYGIDADLIVRHTLRILQGAELMCQALQGARDARYNL
ncbi:MAG: cobalamin-binding protein [Gammaproteobacteria bacterium]|nr:cobalamin-binding protein [Gammaproteobacteria bacterium]